MEAVPFEGCTTLVNALKLNQKKIKNNDWLGTKVGNGYEWMTYNDVTENAESLSLGFKELGLIPDVEGEGK